ncbi:MAG: tetratricopeptide repeat protein [Thalassobaculum sp.]
MGSGSESGVDMPAEIGRARDLARRGDLQAAIRELETLARTSRDPAPAIFEIGNLTKAAGLYDQAEAAYRKVLETYPGSIEAATNLANVLTAKGQTDTAIAILRNVQSVVQGNPIVDSSMADALFAADRITEALAAYDALAGRYPDYPPVHANRGEALARLGRHGDAIEALDRAAALDPGNPDIVRNRGFSRLALGQFRAGFADYEARLDARLPQAPVRLNLDVPRWDGRVPPDGPLLVVAEQGLGDEIRFAAALPTLIARGVDTIVECDPRLVDLFSASLPSASLPSATPPGTRVIAFDRRRDGQRPVFDYARLASRLPDPPAAWIEAGSLPYLLRLPAGAPMAPVGFLETPTTRTMLMRARLKAEAAGRPLIGFCWGSGAERARVKGSTRRYPHGFRCSRTWMPPSWICNMSNSESERATLERLSGAEIIGTDGVDKRNDMSAAACLAAAMDAVVGVSSSVTAMAAAAGTPTVEVTPERTWVPLVEGRDAWLGPLVAAYPEKPGDWDEAMRRALATLREILPEEA